MAHVHFRLRRLEREHDGNQLKACFERVHAQIRERNRVKRKSLTSAG